MEKMETEPKKVIPENLTQSRTKHEYNWRRSFVLLSPNPEAKVLGKKKKRKKTKTMKNNEWSDKEGTLIYFNWNKVSRTKLSFVCVCVVFFMRYLLYWQSPHRVQQLISAGISRQPRWSKHRFGSRSSVKSAQKTTKLVTFFFNPLPSATVYIVQILLS